MSPLSVCSCNKNNSSSLPMKIAVVGGDGYINSVLRPYVDLFSSKSPDWLNYIRFLVVPFGSFLSLYVNAFFISAFSSLICSLNFFRYVLFFLLYLVLQFLVFCNPLCCVIAKRMCVSMYVCVDTYQKHHLNTSLPTSV